MSVERWIEAFHVGGYTDPDSGREIGHHCRKYLTWTPELEEMRRENAARTVSCLELTTTNGVKRQTACLSLPMNLAKDWIKEGMEVIGGEDIARAYAQHRAPMVVVQKDPEIAELKEMMLVLQEKNVELEGRLAKRRTPAKAKVGK